MRLKPGFSFDTVEISEDAKVSVLVTDLFSPHGGFTPVILVEITHKRSCSGYRTGSVSKAP